MKTTGLFPDLEFMGISQTLMDWDYWYTIGAHLLTEAKHLVLHHTMH